jgi:hypothetical protein
MQLSVILLPHILNPAVSDASTEAMCTFMWSVHPSVFS